MRLSKKEGKLKEIIDEFDSAVVSLSGGVDSSLLASEAKEILKDRAIAATARSPTLPSWNVNCARRVAEDIGIKHIFLDTKELENQKFVENPPERCYYCKIEQLQSLNNLRKELGFEKILDGSNKDDLNRDRPGLQAIEEFGAVVATPLAKANLTKKEIRKLAKIRNLSVADKPSTTCLATRIPFGEPIEITKLDKIERAEEYLRSLGFRDLRVRDHKYTAMIEVKREKIGKLIKLRDKITQKLKEIGYQCVSLNLEGRDS